MWDVNVFDYFRREPAVPENEHSRFWPKADACMRQAGLDPQRRLAEIQTCKSQLQNTQDETQTLEDLRKRLPAFSWKQELRDFPLFMAVYAGGLLGLYEHSHPTLYEGTCTAIEIMYTSLVTYDNTLVIVPNSTLIENVVTNYSDKEYRRMVITIPVALHTDTAMACREFAAVASAVPNILSTPAVSCILNGYNADGSAAVLKLYAYATFDNYWNVLYGINNAIQVRRKELGIDQPQTSVKVTEPAMPAAESENHQ